MRREGFELSLSRPKVIFKKENSIKLEPIEEITVDVDDQFSSSVINSINQRKGEMIEMKTSRSSKTRIILEYPPGFDWFPESIFNSNQRHWCFK